ARHRRGQPQLCRRGDAADRAPHEGALALSVEPGMEVVGDPRRSEARLFGLSGVFDEGGGSMLFGREEVAILGHLRSLPRTGMMHSWPPLHPRCPSRSSATSRSCPASTDETVRT